MTVKAPRVTIEEFDRIAQDGSGFLEIYDFVAEEINYGSARMRLRYRDYHVRAGGTMAGPSIMALADFAVFAALMGTVGPVQMAVTSSLNINFLRRPAAEDMIGEALIVKTTKRLAFAEVDLFTVGEDIPVAHVTSTYAIPKVVTAS
ncbi:MAG: PaaI family thioesterase [Alphaproteobacteria bacterium]